ncbi:hypothetical protein AB0O57_29675 [Streptomyces sp. NPDC091201]|uniref:hypothetical protein n=1 Tax=Streptomyces sp. NPDC091201 TaxID=3155190 RepID=UPI003437C111
MTTHAPFSIVDIARAAARNLGSWTVQPGVFSVSATLVDPGGHPYLLDVSDTGQDGVTLCVWDHSTYHPLCWAAEDDGVAHLADTVAVTIRMCRDKDSESPLNAGQHLLAVLEAHRRVATPKNREAGAQIVMPAHFGQSLTITGSSAPNGESHHDYTPEAHHGWTAVLRDPDGAQVQEVYRAPDGINRDLAEDTALLAAVVLPLTPAV